MTSTDVPAALMGAEIREQPAVWRRLLASEQFGAAAQQVLARRPRMVLLAARGTSDAAALYAQYLEVARARGALTVAVTNDAGSELAQVAEVQVDILAGTERAVAATKSYTAQLLALYLLLDRMRGGSSEAAAALPDLGDELLLREPDVLAQAQRYRFAQRLVTTARGQSYATELGGGRIPARPWRRAAAARARRAGTGSALPVPPTPGHHGPRVLLPDRPRGCP